MNYNNREWKTKIYDDVDLLVEWSISDVDVLSTNVLCTHER